MGDGGDNATMIDTLPAAHVAAAVLTTTGITLMLRYAVIKADPADRGMSRRRALAPRLTPAILNALILLALAGCCWYLLPAGPAVAVNLWLPVVLVGILVVGVGAEPAPWARRVLWRVGAPWRFAMALGVVVSRRISDRLK